MPPPSSSSHQSPIRIAEPNFSVPPCFPQTHHACRLARPYSRSGSGILQSVTHSQQRAQTQCATAFKHTFYSDGCARWTAGRARQHDARHSTTPDTDRAIGRDREREKDRVSCCCKVVGCFIRWACCCCCCCCVWNADAARRQQPALLLLLLRIRCAAWI